MCFIIHVDGATVEEFERGVAAAQAVSDAAGVTPPEAATANFARVAWDLGGFQGDGPTDPVMDAPPFGTKRTSPQRRLAAPLGARSLNLQTYQHCDLVARGIKGARLNVVLWREGIKSER